MIVRTQLTSNWEIFSFRLKFKKKTVFFLGNSLFKYRHAWLFLLLKKTIENKVLNTNWPSTRTLGGHHSWTRHLCLWALWNCSQNPSAREIFGPRAHCWIITACVIILQRKTWTPAQLNKMCTFSYLSFGFSLIQQTASVHTSSSTNTVKQARDITDEQPSKKWADDELRRIDNVAELLLQLLLRLQEHATVTLKEMGTFT